MSDIHITPDLLAAVARRDLPARVLTEVGWNHLMNLCPTCREGFKLWQEQRNRPAGDYEAALRVIPPLLERHAVEVEEKEGRAAKDFRALLRLKQPQRLARIRRANTRFKGVTLANRLTEEAKKHLPANLQGMYDLAEAAEEVLLRSTQAEGYYDALVRATAYRANALRAMGKLKEAESGVRTARSVIRHEAVTDTFVYAEVDEIEGALRKDQRRFSEAEEVLSRAALLYELVGARTEGARVLLALGLMFGDRQNLTQAIEATQAALARIDPENEPRLYLCCRHNLTLFLVEGGQYDAAAEALRTDEELYQQFADFWTKLRQSWLKGKVAFGTWRLAEAEQAFLVVRDGFVAQGVGYDAAMVSLDLALLYLKEGRIADVRRLAEEMHPIFAAADVHREAAAALLLFQEAARREVVTSELVVDLAAYLKRARENPELRFRRPA